MFMNQASNQNKAIALSDGIIGNIYL